MCSITECSNRYPEVFEDHREVQIDEYETDSDDEESDFEEHSELVNTACVTRSGRAIRAFVRLSPRYAAEILRFERP